MKISALCGIAAAVLAGCGDARQDLRALGNDAAMLPDGVERRVVDGDAQQGRKLLAEHACITCHAIPGEREPTAHVGPPLMGFARRTNVGGSLPNRPEVLVRFIMNAPQALPGTAMPNLAVSEAEARHLAAFLYTLQ